MARWMVAAALALMPVEALAGAADGVWKTGTDAAGDYLEVTIATCASDSAKSCGTISKAFSKAGEAPGYKYLGKLIIENMTPDGTGKFSGGTIWNPEDEKTYKAKLIVKGNTLEVDGCVMAFCKEKDWTRVK